MKAPITFLQGTLVAIIVPIILLIIFIIFSNHNTFGLVEANYYQKGLTYQSQIDRETRTNQLAQNVNIDNDKKGVVLQFPSIFSPEEISGKVKFIRPSNPNKDFNAQINLDEEGRQNISSPKLLQGAWIVKIDWNNQQEEYYSEKRIFVNR